MEAALATVPRISPKKLKAGITIIDTRPADAFKAGHLPGAINLQNSGKFETWLGSVINNDEPFYLIAANEETLEMMIRKTAKIGYEQNILAGMLPPGNMAATSPTLDLADFNRHSSHYTIIDARNNNEVEDGRMFKHALSIPLPELRERLNEIPVDKPIVVHCAGGYRSAAAASIVAGKITQVPVYDLSEEIANYPAVN